MHFKLYSFLVYKDPASLRDDLLLGMAFYAHTHVSLKPMGMLIKTRKSKSSHQLVCGGRTKKFTVDAHRT